MPTEEMPSHSDSEISGGSPPDRTCSNSETSSGIHSNSSRDSENQKPHDQSAVPIFSEATQKIHPQQWIQRNIIHSPPPYNNNRVYKPQQHYAVASKTPVINEVAEENTVVIRRKNSISVKPPTVNLSVNNDRYCRPTNIRMTSFSDYQEQSKLSATLPHYPTSQPVGIPYQHCSTMPLPISNPNCNMLANGGSCSSFPSPRPHATIPTHHNGIRLCNQMNPYSKFPLPAHHGYPLENQHCALNTSHHTFPQIPVHPAKYYLQKNAERDSANFSMGSSGDSDVCNATTVS